MVSATTDYRQHVVLLQLYQCLNTLCQSFPIPIHRSWLSQQVRRLACESSLQEQVQRHIQRGHPEARNETQRHYASTAGYSV